ncbi:hypothetical protein FKW77_005389 [Venturia effusa]|uniref:Uncharacterized protein n=1 Tax=Venturia effusa TaxID=50376 RepID=A0A517LNY3_9PEZI|nr:hypothetical protein FKW77_005389 [Venturia effusa]
MLRDRSVFVDGGVQLFRKPGSTWLGFNKYMFEIDLSKPWDAKTNFTERRIGRFGDSSMGSNPPNMVRGGLWRGPPNDSRLYTFGGSTFLANRTDVDWKPPQDDRYSLWSFDTASLKWAQYDITYAVPRRPNRGSVTEAIDLGVGFSLNGQVDRGSSEVMYTMEEYIGGRSSNITDRTTYLGGLVIVDVSGPVKVRNVSTESLGPPRVAGGLIYAQSFGKTINGSLITFGGMKSVDLSTDNFRNGALIGFETVALCDSWQDPKPIWFTQPTSGEIPPPRIDFCILPVPKLAKDNSSHNFYMYGGYDPTRNIMYDDVWVISLPSFTWVKLDSGGSNARFGHTCHRAGESHMISIGGSLDGALYGVETSGQIPTNLDTMKCDPTALVRIFDLSLGGWGTYSPGPLSPAYRVPAKLVAVIGGSGDGGATMNSPKGGWAHPALAAMFDQAKRITKQSGSAGAGAPLLSSKRQSRPNYGAIAGGVIGGLVGSIILLGLAILYKRRTAPQIKELPAGDTPPYTHYDGEPKELPGDEGSAKEMSGSELDHELEAKVPGFVNSLIPVELESPTTCHEKDANPPAESPVLPVTEYQCGTESDGTREGSIEKIPL